MASPRNNGPRKISLATWADELKAGTRNVGEFRFSHINDYSHVEFDAKLTMKGGQIDKFQKELEALLAKYHVEDIWAEKREIDKKLRAKEEKRQRRENLSPLDRMIEDNFKKIGVK